MDVDVVVPVHNEERDLEPSIRSLSAFLCDLPLATTVTIADNASTDGTEMIGRRLAPELECVRYLRLEDRGRGPNAAPSARSSRAATTASCAPCCAPNSTKRSAGSRPWAPAWRGSCCLQWVTRASSSTPNC